MRNLHTVNARQTQTLQAPAENIYGYCSQPMVSQSQSTALQPLPHYMDTFWLLGEAVGVATGCGAKINSHNNKK